MWKSVIHVRSTRPWWTNCNLKKILTMYSYIAQPPARCPPARNPTTRFLTAHCPVFSNLNDYNHYYYEFQRQGHPWFTLDRIDKMVCECGITPTLSLTQSGTNHGKMYLRCSQSQSNVHWRCHKCIHVDATNVNYAWFLKKNKSKKHGGIIMESYEK